MVNPDYPARRIEGKPEYPVPISVALLKAVRDGASTAEYRRRLAEIPREEFATGTTLDNERMAFWMNVYNAFAQHLLDENPDLFEAKWFGLVRPIFTEPLVTISGHDLSLNDIEHGILRSSMSAIGLGYLPRVRPDEFEREHCLSKVDPRLHFALNCGARSCPPIRVFTADDVDEQLDAATRDYLAAEVQYDESADEATIPRLMLWYRGDFGGKSGIYEFLHRYDAIPEDHYPSLSYADYDWSMKLGRFRGPE